jgi:hypothetical protein
LVASSSVLLDRAPTACRASVGLFDEAVRGQNRAADVRKVGGIAAVRQVCARRVCERDGLDHELRGERAAGGGGRTLVRRDVSFRRDRVRSCTLAHGCPVYLQREQSNLVGESWDTRPLEVVEHTGKIFWRTGQRRDLLVKRREDHAWPEVELVEQELVGVRGLDPAILQSCRWEVLEVEGHQRLGMPSDRSGQDVPIVLVGQVEAGNEVLLADHGCVFEGCVHELDPPSDPRRGEVGSDAKDRFVRLLEDLRRPERAE